MDSIKTKEVRPLDTIGFKQKETEVLPLDTIGFNQKTEARPLDIVGCNQKHGSAASKAAASTLTLGICESLANPDILALLDS